MSLASPHTPRLRRPIDVRSGSSFRHFLSRPTCLLFCLLLLASTACKRMSSSSLQETDAPNPLIADKAPTLEASSLSQTSEALFRSASLTLADAAKLLGSFEYKADASYLYTRKDRSISLKEKVQIFQRPDGAFRSLVENDQQKATEILWTGKELFWRGKGRPWRSISRDVQQAWRWQRQSYGRWRAIVGIFGPALRLEADGSDTIVGQDCVKFRVSLRSQMDSKPPVIRGGLWDGPAPKETRGLAAKEERTPQTAQGTLWVGRSSGLVLQVHFKGRYQIGEGASGEVSLKAGFTKRDTDPISAPKDIATIAREPDPIDPFGRKPPFFLQPPPSPKTEKQ